MRPNLFALFALALAVSPTPTLALERTAARLPLDSVDEWTSAYTCALRYFNTCTGWTWVWSGWSPGDRLGVCSVASLPSDFWYLTQTRILIASGAPAGYGGTGTVAVYSAGANGCPTGSPLASQPWLPTGEFSYQVHNWELWMGFSRECSWVLLYTFGGAVYNPSTVVTDRPAAGPTGPEACGYCYPTDRTNHTFYYGRATSPLCPGSPLFDGVCDAELVVVQVMTNTKVAVDSKSWGSVKALYR